LTVTVTLGGSPVVGESVTVVSSNTSVATADAISELSVGAQTAWTLQEVTRASTADTSPAGAAVYRYTETGNLGSKYMIPSSQPSVTNGKTYRIAMEVRPSASPTTRNQFYISEGGSTWSINSVFWTESTGVLAQNNGALTAPNGVDLGDGWWRYEITETAGASAASDFQIGPASSQSNYYTGNTGNYQDIGKVWLEDLAPVTDSNGQVTIRVRAVAAGTANITATAGGVDSNTSAITVSNAQTLTATRYTDGDTFGSATLVQGGGGPQTLTASRYTDGDTFGNAALRARTTLVGQRYVDPDTFGNAALRSIARLVASRYADPDTFGNATLVQAAVTQTLVASRYADADTFGNASLRGRATLATTRYANTQTFGNAALRARYTLAATRVADGDAFGNAVLRARTTLAATRHADGDAFGNAVLRTRTTLAATAYANAPTFGAAVLNVGDGKQYLTPTRYANASVYGNATLRVAARVLTPTLYADGDAFGAATLYQPPPPQTLGATLVENASAFGAHELLGGDAGTAPEPAPVKERGAGGMPRRRYIRVWDGEEWIEVYTVEAAQAVIEAAEAKAAQAAQEAAQRLAERPKVRMRAARRAAPVVRVEAPQEDVAAIQRRVEETNAKLREMYENALRAEIIGRLIRQRLEEDEEDAILALLD
jgi:hypothetical protein